jgi:hypothetical protein
MCDYSLHSVKSRPAKVGDKLTTHNFNTGTRGLAAPEDVKTAVCVLPGTELAFAKEVRCGQSRLLAGKRVRSITRLPSSGKSTRTTREHIMMRWRFQTGRWCSSLTYLRVRKQLCSSFRHNPLPQPRRRLKNESRTSADRKLQHCLGRPQSGGLILRAKRLWMQTQSITPRATRKPWRFGAMEKLNQARSPASRRGRRVLGAARRAKKRELAASHSITSSAWASSLGSASTERSGSRHLGHQLELVGRKARTWSAEIRGSRRRRALSPVSPGRAAT